jgi:S1-C subfamily serine protease
MLPTSPEFDALKPAVLKVLPDVYDTFRPYAVRVFMQRPSGVIYSQSGFILPNGDTGTATHGLRVPSVNRRIYGKMADAATAVPFQIKRFIPETDMTVVHPERIDQRMAVIPDYKIRPQSEPLIAGEPLIAIGNGNNSDVVIANLGVFKSMKKINVPAPDGHEQETIESLMRFEKTGSGSVLVDGQKRLVGMMIQSSADQTRSYAMPVHRFIY